MQMLIDTLSQDLRLALRMMRRSPGFTATIALTLALGIGANSAIFAVVNSLLLRPLPVADPGRLVTISSESAIARGYTSGFGWTFAMWEALRPHAALFGGAAAWMPARFDLADGGERQPVDGIFASGSYFATLGVRAIRGRTFTPDDDRPGGGPAGPVAVISHSLWQRRFGGSDSAIGAPLRLDGVAVTIAGVMPPEFSGVDVGRTCDVAVPLSAQPLIHHNRPPARAAPLLVMLRLKDDQSLAAGTAAIRALQPELLGVTPAELPTVSPPQNREPFTLVPAGTGTSLPVLGPAGLRQSYERPLLTILVIGLLVLLIACLNITNLLLARGAARRHELSVRLALGAPRGRLARQMLVESLALAVAGGVGGILIARWSSQALVAQLSTPATRIALDVSFDWRIFAFTVAVALATVVIFGTVPAFRTARVAPIDVLKGHGRTTAPGMAGARGGASMSGGLVIVQIAVSLTLVIAAALLLRSFARLSGVPLGFDPDRVLVVNVDTERAHTNSPGPGGVLYQRIVDAVANVPGVEHAGGSIWTPVDGGLRLANSETHVSFNFVTPGWFAAYGTALRNGRDFTAGDRAGAPPVAIVNETFVRRLLPGRSPVGAMVPSPGPERRTVQRTIVGVVEDSVFESQRDGIQAIMYLPIAQSAGIGPRGSTEVSVGVRPAAGAPMQLARSVGSAIEGIDPGLSFSFLVLRDHVRASVRQERLVAILSGSFGALALLIAALGLYGVTSCMVNRRVVEIGIRRALGAQRSNVLRLVLGHTLSVVVPGIVLGVLGAAAITRYLGSLLYDLPPLDAGTFLAVSGLFAGVTMAAASIPAHRATTVEPVVALRNE